MGTQSKRKSKMMLKPLKFKSKKEYANIWKIYTNVYDAAQRSGYTTTAIYNWIKTKKISAWQFRNMIVIRKDEKLPPGSLLGLKR